MKNEIQSLSASFKRQIKKGSTGGTFSTTGRPAPTFGFTVSLPFREKVCEISEAIKSDSDTIAAFLEENYEILSMKGNFFGYWIGSASYGNSKRVYLDVSVNIADKKEAVAFGRSNGQLAIWDVFNSSEITL